MFGTMTPWGTRKAWPLTAFMLPDVMDRLMKMDDQWWPTKEDFAPEADVIETAGRYDVKVELPGMKPEDVKVEIEEGHLIIQGTKQEEKKEEGKTFHRVERRFGEFRRVLPLPGAVNDEQVTAQFKDGVLTVAIPKAEGATAKRIEVKG
jgi:HSP20 family protein